MRRRVADEAGFTLIELLVTMTIGVMVLGAAFVVVQWATQLTGTTQDRVDAQQRGRRGLEDIITQLRSVVCVKPASGTTPNTPIIAADANRVEVYANLGGPDSLPQRRVLTYDPTKRTIVEQSYQGQPPAGGTPLGSVVLPITGIAKTRTLLENVAPIDSGTPIFRYWAYQIDSTVTPAKVTGMTQLSSTVAAADLKNVVQVDVNFRARPANATTNNTRDAILKNSAYLRLSNPLDPTSAPCS
jgi:prepilin-type N-terminal cleavage/methylation domain-containing protein